MLLAQEIVVRTPPDQVGRVVSVVALIVAVMTAWVTYWQGRVIRKIESTEHEWEKIDRVSASIEVTAQRYQETYLKDGRVVHDRQSWLRLRNTGRALAHDVKWASENDVLVDERDSLELLHPGEHYDVYFALSLADGPGWLFTVSWTDDRGRQSTERRIS